MLFCFFDLALAILVEWDIHKVKYRIHGNIGRPRFISNYVCRGNIGDK